MRKAIADARSATRLFNEKLLKDLRSKGFKFVRVKALTSDNHYDYVEPNMIVLVPIKELSCKPEDADVYAALDNEMIEDWAKKNEEEFRILLAAG